MNRVVSFFGLFVLMLLAWLLSANRRQMNWRLIISGLALQFVLAAFMLSTAAGEQILLAAREAVRQVIGFSDQGAAFLFGAIVKEHPFAFSVLPTIIFVSSLMAVLFYLGVMQRVVQFMARIMAYIMDSSGSESLVATANIFMGMCESPFVVRPYIRTMTRSELMVLMTSGMATISGATLAAFAAMGIDPAHLLTCSLIAAPASIVIAKIMLPEIGVSDTKGKVKIDVPKTDANIFDAACRGAGEGTKLAINLAAILICFVAGIALVNWLLSFLPAVAGSPLSLERMLGWIFSPIAWIMGVQWNDAATVGMLIGKKTAINEFVAYQDMANYKAVISPRSFILATYALCGFANFGSIAVLIGAVGSLEPSRRPDFAKLGLRAMIAGSLASFMTAAIAGVFIP